MARAFAVEIGLVVLGLASMGSASQIEKPAILWDLALEGEVYGSELAGDTVVLLTVQPGAREWGIEAHAADSGKLAWKAVAPGHTLGPGLRDSITVGGRDGIRALDRRSGKERWRFHRPVTETNPHDGSLGRFSSPALLDGECLYAADFVPHAGKKDAVGVSTLYCISPVDGKRHWSTPIPTGTIGPSLASDRDTVLVMREFGASAVDKRTRQMRWSIDFNSVRVPAVVGKDAAFLPGHGLRAVSLKNGSTIWERSGAPVPFGPTLVDGLLYAPLPQLAGEVNIVPGERVGTLRHLPQYIPTFVALDPATGQKRWERPFPNEIRAAAVGRDGFYVVCWDGHLYSVDRLDGSIRWKLPLEFGDWAPTPLVWKNRVILAFQRRLVAIGEAAKGR